MNEFPKSEVIIHYASPYYDPVKAHEYYEAHKKLKGRTSTSGLNEKGREAAKYVRDTLSAIKKKKTEQSKTIMKNVIDTSRSESKSKTEQNKRLITKKKEAYKAETQSSINSLRNELKGLSSEDKKGAKGEKIRNKITNLRNQNAQRRKYLQEVLSSTNKSLREQHKGNSTKAREQHKANVEAYKNEYTTKYEQELENLRSDSSMVSKKKRKK